MAVDSYARPSSPPSPRRKQQRQQYRPGEPIADKQPVSPQTHNPTNSRLTMAGTRRWRSQDTLSQSQTLSCLPLPNDIKGLVGAFTALPRFLYFSVLLFLPSFYRKRVHRIFNGVHLAENEMASRYVGGPPAGSWRPKHWEEVKHSWSDFIDSTLKEWSTLNIVSVLLLS